MPVTVEAMGAWGHSSLKFIQEIEERVTMASGDEQATFKLPQNISMEVQRGNIASILGTLPSPKSFNQLFYLLTKIGGFVAIFPRSGSLVEGLALYYNCTLTKTMKFVNSRLHLNFPCF